MQLLQVTDVGLAYIVIGGFAVAFSMASLLIRNKLHINEVVLGTVCGIMFGPYGANLFNPRSWVSGSDLNAVTLEIMRITLAVGLFTIGVELPKQYIAKHAKGLLVMVVPTMAFGWIAVAVVIKLLFPNLAFVSSLAVAACLTPTDPIISAAILRGRFATKHVPVKLRCSIAAESAANDGLAYPFLSISIYLVVEQSAATAFRNWVLIGCLYQVVLGTIIGSLLGMGFSRLLKVSHRYDLINRESYVVKYLTLTVFTVGIVRTLGSDDLLAAFAAGCAMDWDGYFSKQIDDEVFSSVIDFILNCATFVYIGAWMPFAAFTMPALGVVPWRLAVLFVCVLLVRRIPVLLALYKWVPEIVTWKEALFTGHFGPMGVGAIFISTLALTELPTPQSPPQTQPELLAATLQTIVAFVVLGSIIIHGLSIPLFSLCRSISARTLRLRRTWSSRQATQGTSNAPHPEWLLSVRRLSDPMPVHVHVSSAQHDVQCASNEILAGTHKLEDLELRVKALIGGGDTTSKTSAPPSPAHSSDASVSTGVAAAPSTTSHTLLNASTQSPAPSAPRPAVALGAVRTLPLPAPLPTTQEYDIGDKTWTDTARAPHLTDPQVNFPAAPSRPPFQPRSPTLGPALSLSSRARPMRPLPPPPPYTRDRELPKPADTSRGERPILPQPNLPPPSGPLEPLSLSVEAGEDLAAFLTMLRQRGPSSPSLRGVRSPVDGSSSEEDEGV